MSTEIAVVEEDHGLTLFGTNDPVAVIDQARRVAEPLAQLIRDRSLATVISGKEHVRVEGWTLLGSMLGVFPVTEWTRPVTDTDGNTVGWEARVTAQTRDGAVIGAAEAECLRSEKQWASRDDYALRSMSQTRAASKALRMPLGFVMQLAGFDPTPAEEMSQAKPTAASDEAGACPSCGEAVWDNRSDHETNPKKPAFKCSNRDCEGGGEKKGGGRWPWATWDATFFDSDVQGEGPGDVIDRMLRLVANHVGGDEVEAWVTAEALIYEAANELGVVWPDQNLEPDQLNALYAAALARHSPKTAPVTVGTPTDGGQDE